MGEHTLTIENQKRLSATAVGEVDGFSDKEIRLKLVNGKRIIIYGQNLKVINFQKQSGNFMADGEINRVIYQNKTAGNFFKRLVK